MNLHEYQAKQLFAKYGVPVPEGLVAATPVEAVAAAERLGGDLWVIKAQVHAGGRGKAGGVKLARNSTEVSAAAEGMLGQRLTTKQTGAEGLPINQVFVEAGSGIERELYLSLLVDRSRERIAIMASQDGGMDIEEVADSTPERIITIAVHPAAGLQPYQSRQLGFALELDSAQLKQFVPLVQNLYRLFSESDASLIEINPLIGDSSQEDPMEHSAAEHDLSYVSLDGNIACMVNGAGLAMATMDLIKLHGGEPANFLDVGGGATPDRVAAAFKLILSNAAVEAILVNIFGGIVRCDDIANGIIQAVRDINISVPVIVRLEGTNVEAGKALLADSGLDITAADDLTDAARKVVAAV